MKKSIYNVIIIILLGAIVGICAYILFFNNEKKIVVDVKLDKKTISLYIGESEKLDVTLDPIEASINDLTWDSNDKAIATVTSDGVVTGNNIGDTIITVKTKDGYSDTCIVHVNRQKKVIELDKTSLELIVGNKEILKVKVDNEEKNNNELTWSSSNSNIATVNELGEIEGISSGTTKITASIDGEKATCVVNVSEAPKIYINSINLNKKDLVMIVGSKDTLVATINPLDATEKELTWLSSDSNVVSVNNGNIQAKSIGEVVVTVASSNDVKATCNIKVVDIKNHNITNPVIEEYLKDTSHVSSNYNKNNCGKNDCIGSVLYETKLTGDINLYRYNEKDYTKELIAKTNSKEINYFLIPNTIYYLEEANNKNNIEVVKITGSIRYIKGLINMRDLGGWNGDNGTVKYGLLFRSGTTNSLKTLTWLNYLGVKRVVDLRPNSEITKSSAVESIRVRNPITYYTTTKEVHDGIEKIMNSIVNENKGVLFNCNFGRDRTGTIAYILEGILGVSKEDRKTDFELTYFSSNNRTRNDSAFNNLINQIDKFNSTNYEQEKFINWYLSFSKDKNKDIELINNFKKKLINGNPHEYKIVEDKLVLK